MLNAGDKYSYYKLYVVNKNNRILKNIINLRMPRNSKRRKKSEKNLYEKSNNKSLERIRPY
jgi:hypothetical protein